MGSAPVTSACVNALPDVQVGKYNSKANMANRKITTRSGRELILPTVEEDADITAACDPDDRPLTDQEWLSVKLASLPPARQARIARMTEELIRETRTADRAARPPSPDTRPWSTDDGIPPGAPPANCPAPVAPDQPDPPAASASPGHPPE